MFFLYVFLLYTVTYHIRYRIRLLGQPKMTDYSRCNTWELVPVNDVNDLLFVMFCLVCVGFVFVFCYYDNEMI